MPVSLPNLTANPVWLEEVEIVGAYVQGGHGTEIDYYNPGANAIVPGEPISIFDRLWISKTVILPDKFGTIASDCWVDYLLDPDQATDILQGAVVYFDYDLADGYITGYATSVQPSNGFKLGHAVARRDISAIKLNGSGVPIAAKAGASRILVRLLVGAPTSYGSVPDFAA